MNDLIEFLRARLDEAEAEAQRVEPNQAPVQLRAMVTREGSAPFLVIDSELVRREIRAKRQLIEMYEREIGMARKQNRIDGLDRCHGYWEALHAAASVYDTHPDYRPEWRAQWRGLDLLDN